MLTTRKQNTSNTHSCIHLVRFQQHMRNIYIKIKPTTTLTSRLIVTPAS